jgi:hypothetical protein
MDRRQVCTRLLRHLDLLEARDFCASTAQSAVASAG